MQALEEALRPKLSFMGEGAILDDFKGLFLKRDLEKGMQVHLLVHANGKQLDAAVVPSDRQQAVAQVCCQTRTAHTHPPGSQSLRFQVPPGRCVICDVPSMQTVNLHMVLLQLHQFCKRTACILCCLLCRCNLTKLSNPLASPALFLRYGLASTQWCLRFVMHALKVSCN